MIWALYHPWTLDTLVSEALWSRWCRWWWGCHRSPRRLVATLPRRWRSGCRRGSGSGFESRMNWVWRNWTKIFLKLFTIKNRAIYFSTIGPELGRCDPWQVGDVVAIWNEFIMQYYQWPRSSQAIYNTWEAVLTLNRRFSNFLHKVPRRPRVTCCWVFSLNVRYFLNWVQPTFGRCHGMQLYFFSAFLILHSSRQLEKV